MKEIIITLILIICFACTNSADRGHLSEKSLHGHTISLGPAKDTIKLSDIAEEVSYTYLEENDSSLIGSIDRVFVTDSIIVVVDKLGSGTIHLFNNEGMHINSFSAPGRGPGEYTSITDAVLYEGNSSLLVYDSKGRKFLFYTLWGEFLKEIKTDLRFTRMTRLDHDLFAFQTMRSTNLDSKGTPLYYDILISSLEGEIEHMFFPYNPDLKTRNAHYDNTHILVSNQTQILVTRLLENTTWSLINGEVIPYIFWDYGKQDLKADKSSLTSDEVLDMITNPLVIDKYLFGHHITALSDNYLFFNFLGGGSSGSGIFSLRTGRYITFSRIIDDSTGYIIQTPINNYNESFISVLDVPSLKPIKDSASSMRSPNNKADIQNPVLVRFQIKDIVFKTEAYDYHP